MSVLERIWLSMRALLANERGSTVTFLAAAIVPLVAFAGLSVDTARGYLAKQRLSYAIEAAALAAAKAGISATDAEIQAIGQQFFDANFPPGALGIASPTVTYTISANKREISVEAVADVPTALMVVLGFDKMTVGSEATALRESKGLELAIALDNTGSMNGYIDDLQLASHLLIDTLYGSAETVNNLWVAILPFDTRVNLANYPSVVSFTPSNASRVCANPRAAPYTVDDAPPLMSAFNSEYTQWSYGCKATPALALTAEKSTISAKIDAMSASSYTRIDVAAAWTFRMLSPEWRGLWGNPNLPLNFDEPLMDKAAIIMSDGENNPRDGTSTSTTNNRLLEACTAMKSNNIIVYTILYRTNTAALQTLMENCATSSAHYFFAPDADLTAIFKEIANQLSNLRLLSVK